MISEQVIAAIIGAAVVGGLKILDRILDWTLPKDHHFNFPWIGDGEHPDDNDY